MNKSITAYQKVCKILGTKPVKITETFKEIENATLVIVPDKVFGWDKIKELAVTFGKGQPYQTFTYNELYEKYSPEELSGKSTGNEYRYLYVPDEYNVKPATVENQKIVHENDHVPSVLEAVCFWFTLRELEKRLSWDSTYIRHFDLPISSIGGWSLVPRSVVYGGGRPDLDYAVAARGRCAGGGGRKS